VSASVDVHPTAQVDPSARLGPGTRVGAFSVIGAAVTLGPECVVFPHVVLEGPSSFGPRNRFFPFACLGLEPQDLKFAGETTSLEVGEGNTFRESVTVHRGTAGGGGVTRIGSGGLFMAGTHVAHDCQVGDRTIFANAATLAGHVTVEEGATIGAFSGVHQFCRVGRHAYIGGYSVVTQDALPYVLTVGNRARGYGINVIGLERRGFSAESIQALKKAYRILFRSHLAMEEAIETLRGDLGEQPDVDYLVAFVTSSQRGVIR